MALKAGYKGLKDAFKRKLDELLIDTAGMKIVKTIGDGLDLSDEGELKVLPASDTDLGGVMVGDGLSVDEDGTLSLDGAAGTALVLDTEVDTGKTYNGKPIYGVFTKFYEAAQAASHWSTSGGKWFCDLIPANVVDFMLHCEVFTVNSDTFTFFSTSVVFVKSTGSFTLNFSIPADAYIYLEYTKVEED